jgi:hypothetical protein
VYGWGKPIYFNAVQRIVLVRNMVICREAATAARLVIVRIARYQIMKAGNGSCAGIFEINIHP